MGRERPRLRLCPLDLVARRAEWKCVCERTPCVGLGCGVYLPGQAPRRKAAAKTADELRAIRAKAWATRRKRTRAHTDGAER